MISILYLGLLLPLRLQSEEVLLRQLRKARDNVLSNQLLRSLDLSILGNLDLELAFSEAKVQDLIHAGARLGDLVLSGDSEIDASFADEAGDIGRGEEDERNGEVEAEGDVEARAAVELNVGAVEEVESCGVEAALCCLLAFPPDSDEEEEEEEVLLGTAKRSRSLRLFILAMVSEMKSIELGERETDWLTRSIMK